MIQLLAVSAAVLALCAAAPVDDSQNVFAPRERCLTKYRQGATVAETLPTSRSTRVKTVPTTVTRTVSQPNETVYITPSPVTVTTCVDSTQSVGGGSVSLQSSHGTVTSTYWVSSTRTFITGYTSTTNLCTSTATLLGNGTTTVYTGTLTGTYAAALAKRTSTTMLPLPDQRGDEQHLHRRLDWSEGKVPFAIRCVVYSTERIRHEVTTTVQPQTSTLTEPTPTVTVTSTETHTLTPQATGQASTAETITTTLTTTVQHRTGTVFTNEIDCTSTDAGAASATTTQDIRCAPSNLISSVNGNAIQSEQVNATQSVTGTRDASDCCQQCLDNDDCAAMVSNPAAGNCFLWLNKSGSGNATTCPSLIYSDDGLDAAPGTGDIVQAGCGSVVPDLSVAANVMRIFAA